MNNNNTTNTRFSSSEILSARSYWKYLTPIELAFYWRHYTTGKGRGLYSGVDASTSFLDYVVLSAGQSSFEQLHDI